MFCAKCGAEMDHNAEFCPKCGARAGAEAAGRAGGDDSVGPIGIVLFCLPLVGAIMYFVWKDDKPKKAKTACYLALGGTVLGIVLQVIVTMLQP